MINIVILNWKSTRLVCDKVLRLSQQASGSQFVNIRVLVVDNDPNSNERYYANHDFSNIEFYYIWNGGNLGYAEGNNRALKFLVERKFSGNVAIINPDVEFTLDDILKMDYECFGDVGGVMCAAKSPSNNTLYTSLRLVGLRQYWRKDESGVVDTDYLAGSLMIINENVLMNPKIMCPEGLFDARYFLYWEEVDLSKRLLRCNYKLKSVTDVSIVRAPNSSERVDRSFYYLNRNIFLIRKCFKDIGFADVLLYLLGSFAVSIKKLLFEFDSNSIRRFGAALVDGMGSKYGRKW